MKTEGTDFGCGCWSIPKFAQNRYSYFDNHGKKFSTSGNNVARDFKLFRSFFYKKISSVFNVSFYNFFELFCDQFPALREFAYLKHVDFFV